MSDKLLPLPELKSHSIDLEVIREQADEKLKHLCWQTTFDCCQQTLVSYLVTMTDNFGRMRSTLAKVCSQASRNESLPHNRKLGASDYNSSFVVGTI